MAVSVSFIASTTEDEDNTQSESDVAALLTEHLPVFLSMIAIQTCVFVLLSIAGRGGMIRAVAEIYLGVTPEWLACLKVGANYFWALLCSGFVIMLVVLAMALVPALFVGIAAATDSGFAFFLVALAYVAFLVGYVYVLICSIIVFPVIVVENKGPIEGVKRAVSLVQGSWCDVFCVLFIFQVCTTAISALLQNIILGQDPLAVFTPMGVVISYLPQLMFLPATQILQTVVYFNLRIQKEGLNSEVLSREVIECGASADAAAYASLASDSEYKDSNSLPTAIFKEVV
jgi:hypothetical protein